MSDKCIGVGRTRSNGLTRRRMVGRAAAGGALAVGGALLAPAPLRYALAASGPYKIGSIQPLSGGAAAIGKTALVGLQVAVERINKNGGILGREVKLIAEDDKSKPDVGRRKTEKLLLEDEVDANVGGVLSNICLACMPLYERQKIVNMISVCLDTTITGSKCNRYSFRPFDYAPAQAVAFGPYLVNKLGKKWHVAYADYAWGQSTKDAYAEAIKKAGGSVVGATGIPLGTADMTPFLSKISGDFDGLFIIFFGKDAINIINQGHDLGLSRKYKIAGDGAVAVPSSLPALGSKIDGFVGIDRYIPVLAGAARHALQQEIPRGDPGAAQGGRARQPVARPLRPIELRGDELPQARHREVEVPGPQGHDDPRQGPRRPRHEGRLRLPAGRQAPARRGPPGLRAGVHLRGQGRHLHDQGRGPEGQDHRSAGLPLRVLE